jgi:hypothetical protein
MLTMTKSISTKRPRPPCKCKPKSQSKKPPLSNIFGSLPDMLKLQVLEFVGFTPNEPFILDYVCKYKKIIKMVNPAFMREMLDFKIKNPPVHVLMMDNNNVHTGDAYFITPPKKIQSYTLITNKNSISYDLVISEKYKIYIRECNEIVEHLKLILTKTSYPKQDPNDKSIRAKTLYFRDPRPKYLLQYRKPINQVIVFMQK